MHFTKLPLEGAWLIGQQPHEDERGSFARTFCAREFASHNLETNYVQTNICANNFPGIVRGMHLQRAPQSEVKLVCCVSGSIHDIIVDLRPESPTYLASFGVELSADNGKMLYVPKGFAHGYQTLSPRATILYMVSEYYTPGSEYGLRYDDPALNLCWPLPVTGVSVKDRSWALI